MRAALVRAAGIASAILLAAIYAVGPVRAASEVCGDDFIVEGGHFYSQTGRDTGRGYAVTDDVEARFWTAFQREGGIATLGFPVSSRYMFKGLPTQAFQKAILQWDTARDSVNFLNTLDELSLAGKDAELIAFRQTPPHIFLIEDSGLNPAIPVDFAKIMDNHLKLLTLNPVIQQRFQSEPRWLELYGLPVSYADFGPVQVLRAQRQVFQVWTVDGGGGPKGLAVLANGGDLAKEFGLIPEPAIDPVEAVNVVLGEARIELGRSIVSQGDVVVVRLHGAVGPATVALGSTVAPAVCDSGALSAILPISSVAEPGEYVLKVNLIGRESPVELEQAVSIVPTDYPAAQIELSPEVQQLLSPEVVEMERMILDAIFNGFDVERRWTGRFEIPAAGSPTSPFGERRTYGAEGLFDYHRGHDIAAGAGTPVFAAQNGKIVWADALKVRGNAVIIDHGRGVFSGYYHLSAIEAQVGDDVATGTRVGAVGSTGLSTGAHLHWEVRVLNVPVDPVQWSRGGILTD